ncbi:MAG: DUF2723 domain-containing protein, partial [Anaerolineae bacterium]|nr:DUF2723 domain-containing protein [Anaerolineae bacterium]
AVRSGVRNHLALLVVLALLTALYLSTLQTIPNGSDHYLMVDVGETQIVLNVWGTLHATGYPLYVMTGSLLTNLLTALGVNPAAAPGVVSLLWGLAALGLNYLLMQRLTGRVLLAAIVTGLFGLTRMVWIHHSIAEIYTFGLLIMAALLLVAFSSLPHRIYWLAFLGGIGLAHHRAFITMIPALIYAVWPVLSREPRRLPRILFISLLLGMLGLLQYLYLPLQASSPWVYGEPGTLQGLWDQFIGTEASRYIGPPASLGDNFALINNVILTEVTAIGLVLGIIGLLLALTTRQRRAAIIFILNGLAAYLFHVFFYSDVLVALILPISLSLAFGWLFLADWLLQVVRERQRLVMAVLSAAVGLLLAGILVAQNLPFIRDLTQSPTGLETITLLEDAPPDSTLMIAWGMRHFAAGFAHDVLGERPDVTLVDHKADFTALVLDGRLVTPAYTFYDRPLDWWEGQISQPVYLHTAAPMLVSITIAPEIATASDFCGTAVHCALGADVAVLEESTNCAPDAVTLAVQWAAVDQPKQDLSVFVHLLDASGAVIAQADQSAPVYGWYPLTRWQPGEIVRDLYTLPYQADAAHIRYGLYHQLADGSFENLLEAEMPVRCVES